MDFINSSLIRRSTTHFRFEDGRHIGIHFTKGPHYEEPIIIQFKIIKETPKGYWIGETWSSGGTDNKRWVSKTSRKRHAYPTIEEAAESYKIRKQRQIEYAEAAIEKAKAMLAHMEGA